MLGSEISEKAKIFKVDIDKSRDVAERYEVMAVPTLIIFKDGKPVKKIVGFQPKEVIRAKLEQYSK